MIFCPQIILGYQILTIGPWKLGDKVDKGCDAPKLPGWLRKKDDKPLDFLGGSYFQTKPCSKMLRISGESSGKLVDVWIPRPWDGHPNIRKTYHWQSGAFKRKLTRYEFWDTRYAGSRAWYPKCTSLAPSHMETYGFSWFLPDPSKWKKCATPQLRIFLRAKAVKSPWCGNAVWWETA